MGRLSRWVGGVLFLWASAAHAYDSVEAYGDSLTAGFMSRTDVTHAPPLPEMSGIISDLAMFFMTKDRTYLAKHHAPELAWPALLATELGGNNPLPLDNHAVSGARSWNLLDEVKSHPQRGVTTRAFFFIGHNDLCNSTDSPQALADSFKQEVGSAVEEWDRNHKDSVAYLVPVGKIGEVYKILNGYVWHKGSQKNYSCVDSWTKLFPYCVSHYAKFKAGILDTYLNPRRDAMNTALEKLSEEWTLKSSSNQFHYLANAQDIQYAPEFFAVDCFHLSPTGQKAVAERVIDLIEPLE
ncbi:SGNH/GDSL hydrolase family protein [bacterium]|nr:SGNH/GDSL hydrolase family protein [bacterium]